ncbi:MAG: amino acid ABC transporter substrate-binding protein [Leptospiraceae bacterium]|nr:amino acid ABC transporter substrate-binding protein [Leptospiraceae bacterium]
MHFPGSPRISRVAGLALLCVFFLTTPMQAESGLKHRPEGTYLRKLAERGTIRIGIQKNIQPFHIAGNKDFPGFDVEFGLSIARHMGLKPEFVYGDLDELVAMAAREEVDVALGGVSSDLRRGLKVNFTSPYIKTTPAALLNRKALPPETGSVDFPKKKFESLLDLRNAGALKIAVKEGTTNEEILKTDPEFAVHTIKSYPDNESGMKALESEEVDAFVADGVFIKAQTIMRQELLSRFVPLLSVYREEHLSLVLPPGKPEYWMFMEFLVKEMHRTGEIKRIYDTYFSNSEWARDTVVE